MNRRERRAAAALGQRDPNKRAGKCPGCGAFVVCNDATNTLYHPKPECAVFVAKMRELGMNPNREEWAELVDPRDGSVLVKGQA